MPKWFKFFGAVLFLLIAAFAVTNAVFYGLQTDNKDPKAPITSSNATILMWINIVLALLSVFALIYFIMRIYKGDPEGEKKLEVAGTKKQSKTGTAAMLAGFSKKSDNEESDNEESDNEESGPVINPETQAAALERQNKITINEQLEELTNLIKNLRPQGQLGLDPNAQPLSPTPTDGGSTLTGQKKGPPVVRSPSRPASSPGS